MATSDQYRKTAERLLASIKPADHILITTRWGSDPDDDDDPAAGPGIHIRTRWTSPIIQRNDHDEQ